MRGRGTRLTTSPRPRILQALHGGREGLVHGRARALSIPTIGVGAGPHCDGQVLVVHDVFGVYEKAPPFARKYADLRKVMLDALKGYEADVTAGGFPGEEQTFRMDPGEKDKLDKLLDRA